jgi:preprotein translocase subunit SecG
MLQAGGGGLAGGAGSNAALRNKGTDLMIAGIAWQVATLIVFVGLVLDYVIRTLRHWDQVDENAKNLLRQKRSRGFIFGVAVAFLAFLLRCIYRIAETVGGWANPIMRDEAGFMVMEAL